MEHDYVKIIEAREIFCFETQDSTENTRCILITKKINQIKTLASFQIREISYLENTNLKIHRRQLITNSLQNAIITIFPSKRLWYKKRHIFNKHIIYNVDI